MKSFFDDLKEGLEEAIEYKKGKQPVKIYILPLYIILADFSYCMHIPLWSWI